MTRDVDEFLAVLDRWSDEVARAGSPREVRVVLDPPLELRWWAVSTPAGWVRVQTPGGTP